MLTERQSNCAGMDLPRLGSISIDEDFLWESRGQDQG